MISHTPVQAHGTIVSHTPVQAHSTHTLNPYAQYHLLILMIMNKLSRKSEITLLTFSKNYSNGTTTFNNMLKFFIK